VKIVDGLNGGLNPELTELYQAVKDNPGKKAKELAVLLSRPIDTVDKQISKLIDECHDIVDGF